jgi:cysteine-rich repeat protein
MLTLDNVVCYDPGECGDSIISEQEVCDEGVFNTLSTERGCSESCQEVIEGYVCNNQKYAFLN